MRQEKGDATSILVVARAGQAIRSAIAVASANRLGLFQKRLLAAHPLQTAIRAIIAKAEEEEAAVEVSFGATAVNTVEEEVEAALVATLQAVVVVAVNFAVVGSVLLRAMVKALAGVAVIEASATAALISVRFSISRFIPRTLASPRWLKRFAILVAPMSCSKLLG